MGAALSLFRAIFIALAMGTIAFAQDDQQATQTPGIDKPLSAEDLMALMANEKVVIAGVGFFDGQLGDPLTYILEVWGEPVDARKNAVLGSTELLYQPDPDTLVVFTGTDNVESISIKGTPASLLRTRRGARFGFSALQVLKMYSRFESETVSNRLNFKSIGLEFSFVNDQVDKIVVYPKES